MQKDRSQQSTAGPSPNLSPSSLETIRFVLIDYIDPAYEINRQKGSQLMTENTTTTAARAFALADGEGETLWWESQLLTIKCSLGGLGLVEGTVEAGSEPPMHIHTRENEYIYVLDGEVSVYVGDEKRTAQAGGFVFMPRNVPHTFAVEGTGQARVFLMYTPNGFERVFWDHRTADYVPGVPGPEAARHDLNLLGKAFDDAGLIITGPHPRDT